MNAEHKIILKRIITLICSMIVMVCFGQAIAGMGGYLVGRGRPMYVLLGLCGGAAFSCAAVAVWKSYISDITAANAREREDEAPPP
ncbi:MAG: hypothetical protein LBL05_08730 [Synergistaceae bacterium]|jgi:hypothetical protein|nr:hypothetical protein [Synergistaceae bacterium]